MHRIIPLIHRCGQESHGLRVLVRTITPRLLVLDVALVVVVIEVMVHRMLVLVICRRQGTNPVGLHLAMAVGKRKIEKSWDTRQVLLDSTR